MKKVTVMFIRQFKNTVLHTLVLSFTFLNALNSKAQNCYEIVQNGDFESNTNCPNIFNQVNLATPWTNGNLTSGFAFAPFGTPDYFNSCSTTGIVGEPQNMSGWQQPHSGNGYVGLVLYHDSISVTVDDNFREYVTQPLSSPMIVGETYKVEFYWSLGNLSKYAVDGLGVNFSTSAFNHPNNLVVPLTPQVSNPSGNFLSDTANWNLFSGTFTATQANSFMTIGNFLDDANTQKVAVTNSTQTGHSYIVIDDVSVICTSCMANSGNDTTVQVCHSSNSFDMFNALGPNANPGGFWTPLPSGQNGLFIPGADTSGVYTYTTYGLCDTALATVHVVLLEDSLANWIPPAACSGDAPINLNNVVTSNPGGSWFGTGVSGNFFDPTFGTQSVTYEIDSFNCILQQSNQIAVNDLTLNLTATPATCAQLSDGSAIVTAYNGLGQYAYMWQTGNPLDTNAIVTNLDTGFVSVVVTDQQSSCQKTDSIYVNALPDVRPDVTANVFNGCPPLTVNLLDQTGINVNHVIWEISNGIGTLQADSSLYSFSFNEAGTYNATAELSAANGCLYSGSDTLTIIVHSAPDANFYYNPGQPTTANTTVNFNDNSSSDVIVWDWQFQGNNFVTTSTDPYPTQEFPLGIEAEYTASLIVTNGNGCTDSTQQMISIENQLNLFAPNAFTPDGNGNNETWKVETAGIDVYNFHAQIFNKWGEIIWESYHPDGEWDGTYGGGEIVPNDVYVWKIQLKDQYTDQQHQFVGHVTVLR